MKKLLLFCLAAGVAGAQTPPSAKKATFEVASVKENTSGQNFISIGGMGGGSGGRFTVTNMPLQQLIVIAYAPRVGLGPLMIGPNGFPVTGAPGWVSSQRFDIDARAEAGFTPTSEQSQEMLQSLLEERFGLKVRKETKDGPIYALVVDKGGPKMKVSADQTPVKFDAPPPGAGPGGPGGPAPAGAVRAGGGPPPPPPPPGGERGGPFGGGPAPRGGMFMGLGQFKAGAVLVNALTGPLSSQLGRKVVDRTNLTGLYDIELKWTPDSLPNGGALPPGVQLPQVDPNGPTIFTAVQEQLGLKLESATGPIDSLVVEKVDKLIEN